VKLVINTIVICLQLSKTVFAATNLRTFVTWKHLWHDDW